ncbi:kinase [Cyanobium sp. Copco_Reservoir_LC18]|uniref:ATP-binding protein n=1 Tax=Cyanobium sp. Copco_Reservoir_LC18 TaxID=1328305 RepID=UPI001359BA1E|nr:ATP-binding protein [Cyanobium sp. Copco_Reservoir_LC18]KAF0655147.1 kinase [Cyanobium sp. Copco_Reservoir_LC18]
MPSPAPLRCHLLIGAPGSGKTTLARALAPLLQGESGEPALVLSTDAIRADLFGDAAVQGPWDEIRELLLQRLREAVAVGRPVIIDATHARRPWRLLYTQQLQLSRPVEWVSWWLRTPLEQCKSWALRRERPVPEAVIEEFHASINHRCFQPERAEGFAAIVTLNPAAGEGNSDDDLRSRLAGLDRSVRNALNRQRGIESQLHRYARLLDLERLLFLIRLLTSFNGLEESDPGTAAELLQICNPPPRGDLAERAAGYLASWEEVHGGNSDGYGDADAIRRDLAWLEANGFFRLDWQGDEPIELGPEGAVTGSSVNGGYPALADRQTFRRVFSLLRHILKDPFDAPDAGAELLPPGAMPPRAKRARRSSQEFGPLYRHLIGRLSGIEGAYGADQEAVLRYDLDHVLTPYGFLPQVKGRPHSRRQGYAIGTALLSTDQLLEIHALLKASLGRLSDASQEPIMQSLESRLQRAGVLDGAGATGRYRHPKRALANRSITEEKRGTLADPEMSTRVERAIVNRRRIWLRHEPDPISDAQRMQGDDGRFRAWPLQLLFHNISWYLAFETAEVGRMEGLIRTLRVDRLVMLCEDGNIRRNTECEHENALGRLQRLLVFCGGLYLGDDIDEQRFIANHRLAPWLDGECDPVLPGLSNYEQLVFSCTTEVFRLIREEPRRFPPEHTAYSRPLAGQPPWPASPLDTLAPNPSGDSHPHRVEVWLPRWTVEQDWDLRTWLFRWGAGVRIERPLGLRDEHHQHGKGVVDLYEQPPGP